LPKMPATAQDVSTNSTQNKQTCDGTNDRSDTNRTRRCRAERKENMNTVHYDKQPCAYGVVGALGAAETFDSCLNTVIEFRHSLVPALMLVILSSCVTPGSKPARKNNKASGTIHTELPLNVPIDPSRDYRWTRDKLDSIFEQAQKRVNDSPLSTIHFLHLSFLLPPPRFHR